MNHQMPEVFVGIPTINRPDLVRETIQSALNQTYTNIRVIVSDNRSDGNATSLVRNYVESLADPRISFYVQPENLGEYGQGHYFLEQAADTPYFMILHDDDVLKENYIEVGIQALQKNLASSFFVANPFIFDEHGLTSETETNEYLTSHGRESAEGGQFDALTMHLKCGFSPISGTLFRTSSLHESGYVDKDGCGIALFECDIFLSLGDIGAKGWYEPQELIGFRFHKGAMRNYMNLLDNRVYVAEMIRLFELRNLVGDQEKQRRKILGRLYRALSLIAIKEGNISESRLKIRHAIKLSRWSPKSWLIASALLLTPGLLRGLLPALPENLDAPVLESSKVDTS